MTSHEFLDALLARNEYAWDRKPFWTSVRVLAARLALLGLTWVALLLLFGLVVLGALAIDAAPIVTVGIACYAAGLTTAALVAARRREDQRARDDLYHRAVELVYSGRYEEAEDVFRSAVRQGDVRSASWLKGFDAYGHLYRRARAAGTRDQKRKSM